MLVGRGVGSVSGPNFTLQQSFTGSDTVSSDYFGRVVAISGDTIAVGAWGKTVGGYSQAGSVYVFTRSGSTWTEQQIIDNPNPATGQVFGAALDVDGDTLAIGEWNNDDAGSNAGKVHVYKRSGSTWSLEQSFSGSNTVAGDNFGRSLQLDGDNLIVGAKFADDTYSSEGEAYVFTRSGTVWTEQQRLTNPVPGADDIFGMDVSISGDYCVVTAPGDDHHGYNAAGTAYVFVRSGSSWTHQQTIYPPTNLSGFSFGNSARISGSHLVVTAGGGTSYWWYPAVYFYTRSGSTWSLSRSYLYPEVTANSTLCGALVSSDRFIVSDVARPYNSIANVGRIYDFKHNGTTYALAQQILPLEDASTNIYFGSSSDYDSGTIVGGSQYHKVYVYVE